MRTVVILTHIRKGFTDNMVNAIAGGVEEVSGVDAVIKRVNETQPSDLAEADALAIGSPTYLSYMSGELKLLLDDAYFKYHFAEKMNRLKGKPAAAFVCGKTKGYLFKRLQLKSMVLKELERILFSKLEMKKVTEGLHLIHPIDILDPRAPLTLTHKQRALCKNLGNKLALSINQR